jgi:voltage-gated potassium channel Kch
MRHAYRHGTAVSIETVVTPRGSRGPDVRALLIGDLEVTRIACALLAERGVEVVHLLHPSDLELRAELDDTIDAVAVLVRGDVTALRYVLLVEQIRPGVRLVATVFDRTLSDRLRDVVPNCTVRSPADIAVPSIVGACVGGRTLAVDLTQAEPRRLVRDAEGELGFQPFQRSPRGPWSRVRDAVGQLGVHDDATRVLLLGLATLALVLAIDWILSVTVLHQGPAEALYAATRVVTTVGPGEAGLHGHTWYLVIASAFMLLTVIVTAVFTAGVVDRVRSTRSLALVGRRMPPRRDHVIVVGLGQVGLRLALALRRLDIPVLALERQADAPNLRLARQAGIPVLVGQGQDVEVLRRVGAQRARAVAAMSSGDLDNIEVAIAASAVAPALPIALRAGESAVISETRSLFRIGEVRDVSGLTAASVVERMIGSVPVAVFAEDARVVVFDGEQETVTPVVERCTCHA